MIIFVINSNIVYAQESPFDIVNRHLNTITKSETPQTNLTTEEIILLNSLNTSGYSYSVEYDSGLVFIADGTNGVIIAEHSNHTGLNQVGAIGANSEMVDILKSGNLLFCADLDEGLKIINVSDPTTPLLLTSHHTAGEAVGLDKSQNYIYLADGYNGLLIIDVSDSLNPFLVGQFMTPSYAYDVKVQGNYAYVANWTEGLRIIDISNNSNPFEIGYYDTPGWALSVTVNDNVAYVADGQQGIRIIDISIPYSPQEISYFNPGGYFVDIKISGILAYVANGSDGIHLYDISEPVLPNQIESYNTSGSARGISIFHENIFVADGNTGLHVFDDNLTFAYNIYDDWCLIGLPNDAIQKYYLDLYPNAVSPLWQFSGAYHPVIYLTNGRGYFLRNSQTETVLIQGADSDTLIRDLIAGWNIISSGSNYISYYEIIDLDSILIEGTLFGFQGSYYNSDSLKPGNGYWVRANQAGRISINSYQSKNNFYKSPLKLLTDLESNPALQISDNKGNTQKLFLCNDQLSEEEKIHYSMPPIPPSGSFDVRFINDFRISENLNDTISIQFVDGPIKITPVSLDLNVKYKMKSILGSQNTSSIVLENNNTIMIESSEINQLVLTRIYSIENNIEKYPNRFVVSQNYPNPFNAETKIEFNLAVTSNIDIKIYNSLGAKINSVNFTNIVGEHVYTWNGKNAIGNDVSSGIYYLEVNSAENRILRKMLLLK